MGFNSAFKGLIDRCKLQYFRTTCRRPLTWEARFRMHGTLCVIFGGISGTTTNVCLFSPVIVVVPILNSYNVFHASVVSATAVILAIDVVIK